MATTATTAGTNGDDTEATEYGREGKRYGDVRQLTGSTRTVTASPEEGEGDGKPSM